jgi:hypothetical protein
MKRFGISLVCVAAVLALATPAVAAPAKSTTIDASITGIGCNSDFPCSDGGGESCFCFYQFWSFGGQTNISPPLGRLTFTGFYELVTFAPQPPDDPNATATMERVLTLTFTAPKGDSLVVSEDVSWPATDPAPQMTWAVDQAKGTGRFASYTGSGSYSLSHTSIDPINPTEEFDIRLTGTLTSTK